MATKLVHYRKFDSVGDGWEKGTLQHLLDLTLKTATSGGKTYETDWNARRIKVSGAENLGAT